MVRCDVCLLSFVFLFVCLFVSLFVCSPQTVVWFCLFGGMQLCCVLKAFPLGWGVMYPPGDNSYIFSSNIMLLFHLLHVACLHKNQGPRHVQSQPCSFHLELVEKMPSKKESCLPNFTFHGRCPPCRLCYF